MKNSIFLSEKVKTIIFSGLLITFGILFCVMPQRFVGVLEIIVSIFLILFGLINLFGFCCSPTFLRDPFMLFESIVLIVAGFLIDLISNMFVLILGLIIIVFGIKKIFAAVNIKKTLKKDWWIDLIFGIVILILGLIIAILCGTKIVQSAVIILLGCSLIFNGIINLITLFVLHRELKNNKKTEETIEVSVEIKE